MRFNVLFGLILVPGLALAQAPASGAPASAAPVSGAPASAAAGDEAPANPVEKPIRTLINAVRFGKFDLALKFMSGEPLGAALLADEWAKGTPEQRAEFVQLFHKVFAQVAFPKMKERFEHIQAILYDPPEIAGDKATIKSVIVILHAMKKQELKVTYTLVKVGEDWKILDAKVLGDSMVEGIRQDQIIPIMQEGGWTNLLELLRKKAG